MLRVFQRWGWFFVLLCLTTIVSAQNGQDYWPTEAWRSAEPEEHGFPETFTDDLNDFIKDEDLSFMQKKRSNQVQADVACRSSISVTDQQLVSQLQITR